MAKKETPERTGADASEKTNGRFDPSDHFINLESNPNKPPRKYLEVKWRIAWFRDLNPDWTIRTTPEELVRGMRYQPEPVWSGWGDKKTVKVPEAVVIGGYARYRATIHDADGRLRAEGTKTEYSENFLDFVEKAETGAIGRALALAGFGTQFADEIEDGSSKGRPVDAPVATKPSGTTPAPAGQPGSILDVILTKGACQGKSWNLALRTKEGLAYWSTLWAGTPDGNAKKTLADVAKAWIKEHPEDAPEFQLPGDGA